MEKPQEARKVPVLIRDEDWDDVIGHPWRFVAPSDDDVEGQGGRYKGLGQTEEDAEGQIYILKRTEPGEQLDDTEGQGGRYHGISLEGQDTEGQGMKWKLVPASVEDVEGQGGRFSHLRQSDEGWVLEPEDDVEGHPWRYLGETEEDTEGQGRGGVNH